MKNVRKTPKNSFEAPISGALRDLRIADLELFITAARLQSLSKAALLHHLSQSAASAAIQRVEACFGMLLCTHEKRQFRPTKEGLTLLPRAEKWVRQLRESVAAEAPMPIRIATTHAIARVAIPPLLNALQIELALMRPDRAYAAVLKDEADVALVLDNAPWEEVVAEEIGKGGFQLYSKNKEAALCPVLLPEDQIEVLSLQQRWQQQFDSTLPVKARLPSWSLIADICSTTKEVGFLPDFLARQFGLKAVSWQPKPSEYRLLALYRETGTSFQERLNCLIIKWKNLFS